MRVDGLYRAVEVDRMMRQQDAEIADLRRRLRSAMDTIATLTANGGGRVDDHDSRQAELEAEVEILRQQLADAREKLAATRKRPGGPPRGRGREAYNLAARGLTWQEIGERMGYTGKRPDGNAYAMAKWYAQRHGLPWPIRRSAS